LNNIKQTRSVVITGATSGIGFQTALEFAGDGYTVIGVGRDQARCGEAVKKIALAHPNAKVKYFVANLASQQQIKNLAQQVTEFLKTTSSGELDVLVNNAGVYMEKRKLTEEGIETTFAVNHIAPFLLTYLLLPALALAQSSRVITVSSNSHYSTWFSPAVEKRPRFYFGLWAYKVSKLSNVLFTRQLNRVLNGNNPRAFAVDPGLVNTDIGLKGTDGLARSVWQNRQKLGVSAERPARSILYLANAPGLEKTGECYWYDCKPKKPSKPALNDKLAKRLWVESCRICNIPEDWKR
jgi:retinol dehydrogenase-12